MWSKIKLAWVLMGPEELVALGAFLMTIGVWVVTLAALRGR
jgi:hypothetical protein